MPNQKKPQSQPTIIDAEFTQTDGNSIEITPEQWQQVKGLFMQALDQEPGQRDAFIVDACGDNLDLLKKVRSFIAEHEKIDNFLEKPAIDFSQFSSLATAESQPVELTSRLIAHYQLHSILGRGGMGEVFLAEDARLGRKVAIKFLSDRFKSKEERLRRFFFEAKAASLLNHPNIITIYDIGETEANRYIVMEFVEGQTLRNICQQKLSLKPLIEIGTQIAQALNAAHTAGIVHRDIKPENIMVRNDGYVKVLDFGLARLIDKNSESDASDNEASKPGANTTPGKVAGTAAYMSPEQARGEALDSATDIFSYGIVLYEMATGQHPFKSDSAIATMKAIISQTVTPPSQLNGDLPESVDTLILSMLEKDARFRPSAAEVAKALTDHSREEWTTINKAVITTKTAPKRNTVGRDAEKVKLRVSYETAAAGFGSMLCVAGEPGIGKTTLVESFFSELRENNQQFSLAIGRASERLAGAEAYLPFIEALDNLLREEKGLIARTMETIAPTWYNQITQMSAGVQMENLANKPSSQERIKRELFTFFSELSRQKPLIIFFDDLHWADISTVDMLAYLSTKLSSMRVLVVITYRSTELLLNKHPFLMIKLDLQAKGVCREFFLDFLNQADVARYLSLEFPQNNFPTDLARLIHTRTEGNPLFMVDLVRYLRDTRVIISENSQWLLTQPIDTITSDLPESVRSMVQRKIDQLSEIDRKLLMVASIQGYEFDSAIVAKVLNIDPVEIEERLEVLDKVYSLVQLVSEYEYPDFTLTLRYKFVHLLYQNALYSSLQPSRKASWSADVARSLIGLHGDRISEVALEVAFLLEIARNYDQASDFFLMAAQNAAKVFANQEVVSITQRGLKVLKVLPVSPQKLAKELMTQLVLGGALMVTKGAAALETEQSYQRAVQIVNELGDKQQLPLILYGLWVVYFARGELNKALTTVEEIVTLSESIHNPAILVMSYHAAAFTYHHFADYDRALQFAEVGIKISNLELERAIINQFQFSPGIILRIVASFILIRRGYITQANKLTETAMSMARELSHRYSITFTLGSMVINLQDQRDVDSILSIVDENIAISQEEGFLLQLYGASINRGWILSKTGRHEEGINLASTYLNKFKEFGLAILLPRKIMLLAETYSFANQKQEAIKYIDEALNRLLSMGERSYESYIHLSKANILLSYRNNEDGLPYVDIELTNDQSIQDQISTAIKSINRVIDISRRDNTRLVELKATMTLCCLLQKQGKVSAARDKLANIYSWFTEGHESTVLKEARLLLTALESAVTTPVSSKN